MYKVATMAFESAQLAGDGLITKDGSDFIYSYFLKDHLGSTRMVLAQNGEIKQALMYQPYGTIEPVAGIPGTGSDPLRQKFTNKEFDEEGDLNTAPGIQAYYFGARYYDPDLGVWFSRDAADQYVNSYGYSTNPIMIIDPDGNFALQAAVVSAIVGAAVGTVQGIINAHYKNGGVLDYIKETMFWSNVHGLIGSAAGGVGGGIAANIKSGVSGIGGAILAGAASGAVGGAMSYTGEYTANYMYSGFDENYLDAGQYFSGLGKATLIGGVSGAVMGGLTELLPEGEVTLGTEKKNVISHTSVDGNFPGIDFEVSVGPENGQHRCFKHVRTDAEFPSGGSSRLKIHRVDAYKVMRNSMIVQAKQRAGTLRYNIGLNSCVAYGASALRDGGVLSAGVGIHPYWLQAKMFVREAILQFLGASN